MRSKLEKHIFPNWKLQKTHLAQLKTSEKSKKMSKTFSKNVLDKSHSAENPKESSLLAWKPLVSSKNRRGT